MAYKTRKLINDTSYKKANKTFQDKLSKEDIKSKLEDYVKVTDISKVAINSHLRYFSIDENGEKKFRLGGFLQQKDNWDKYVVLSNGAVTWSVDTQKSIFYKKLSLKELKEEYEKVIEAKDKKIKDLMSMVKKLKAKLET